MRERSKMPAQEADGLGGGVWKKEDIRKGQKKMVGRKWLVKLVVNCMTVTQGEQPVL